MKSLFEEHGGKYIQCGDCLIPDLGLTEQEQKPLGKYGRMRREYLEKDRSGLYTRMILDGTLMEHLHEIGMILMPVNRVCKPATGSFAGEDACGHPSLLF